MLFRWVRSGCCGVLLVVFFVSPCHHATLPLFNFQHSHQNVFLLCFFSVLNWSVHDGGDRCRWSKPSPKKNTLAHPRCFCTRTSWIVQRFLPLPTCILLTVVFVSQCCYMFLFVQGALLFEQIGRLFLVSFLLPVWLTNSLSSATHIASHDGHV